MDVTDGSDAQMSNSRACQSHMSNISTSRALHTVALAKVGAVEGEDVLICFRKGTHIVGDLFITVSMSAQCPRQMLFVS